MNSIELTHLTVDLRPGQTVSIKDAKNLSLHCQHGRLWITEENDPIDHWLESGESVTIESTGRVVIEAVDSSELLLVAPLRRSSFGRIKRRYARYDLPVFAS